MSQSETALSAFCVSEKLRIFTHYNIIFAVYENRQNPGKPKLPLLGLRHFRMRKILPLTAKLLILITFYKLSVEREVVPLFCRDRKKSTNKFSGLLQSSIELSCKAIIFCPGTSNERNFA